MTPAKMQTKAEYNKKPGPKLARVHQFRDGARGHAWLDRIIQNHINPLDLLIWGRVQDYNDGPNQADCAPELSQRTQLFAEEIRPKDGSY